MGHFEEEIGDGTEIGLRGILIIAAIVLLAAWLTGCSKPATVQESQAASVELPELPELPVAENAEDQPETQMFKRAKTRSYSCWEILTAWWNRENGKPDPE